MSFFLTPILLMKFIVHTCPFTCPRGQEECVRTKKPKKSSSSPLPRKPFLFRRFSSLMSTTKEKNCASRRVQQMALHTKGTSRSDHPVTRHVKILSWSTVGHSGYVQKFGIYTQNFPVLSGAGQSRDFRQ